MKSSKYALTSFFKEVKANHDGRSIESNKEALKKISLKTGDCFFILDFAENKISHFEGFNRMFDYDLKRIDLPFIFDKIHPDDSVLVQSLIKNMISELLHLKIPKYTNVFRLKLRFAKSNEQFIRILGDNFVLETNKDDIVQSMLIRFTDVSFLNNSEALDWWVNPEYLSKERISKLVYGGGKDAFTNREKEIVLLILSGKNNIDISKKLHISHHTVATHRKNIMSKSESSGVAELELFCKKNGVFA